jgi:pyridoxal phosphate enzyme (YggS family)
MPINVKNKQRCFMKNDCVQKITEIRNEIETLCGSIGRDSREIVLIAAVKTQSKSTVEGLISAVGDVGENRVQEFSEHYDEKLPFRWHFIGQLQTNKVKYLIGKTALIHSLDREELAKEIDRLSAKNNLVTECLIEVNVGGETSKGGLAPSELKGFADSLTVYKNLKIRGLMSVLPPVSGAELDGCYKKLSDLYEELKSFSAPNFEVTYLSAGMSGDYKTAIRYGANMIRLGTAIFVMRN